MKKILLVNPWIYDFAVHDFGIKPVGLLRIAEYIRRHGNEVYLIDCLDGCAKRKDDYGFSKIKKQKIEKPRTITHLSRPYFRYGIPISEFVSQLEKLKDIDSIFVTSAMTYWYPGIFQAIRLIRTVFRKRPIILGGIYATLCHKHASLNSGADFVWKGDYLGKNTFFEGGFYPAYDLLEDKHVLPIQLTQGCPYRCSYCASRLLKTGFIMRDPIALFEEVMDYHVKFGTRKFVFYDDALTCNSSKGIKKFLRLIAASQQEFMFHTPNGLHAKFIDDELAHLFKKTNFRDLRLSLETTDENLQQFTGAKVTNSDLKRALRNLKEAGFKKDDLGVYLLIGAPWLNINKTVEDTVFINSLGAKAILASYSPIPGTQDYTALIKSDTLNKHTDPLWHNKTIFSELLSPSYMEKIQKIRRFTSKMNKES